MKNMFFAALLLTILTQQSTASLHYEMLVTDSPSVHAYTDPITFSLIEQAEYDISKFTTKVTLDRNIFDPKTFVLNHRQDSLSKEVRKILEERFDVYNQWKLFSSGPQWADFSQKVNVALAEIVHFYQEVEAEGVFYRDIKTKMDVVHMDLKGNPAYESHRSSNNGIVDGFFTIVEDLAQNVRADFEKCVKGGEGRCKPEGLAHRLSNCYLKYAAMSKLRNLREKYHLPGGVDINQKVDNSNNQ